MPVRPESWGEMRGRIEVTAGPMFAGKSSFIVDAVERYRMAGASIYIVKHPLDTRYEGLSKIGTHGGRSVECEALANPLDIYARVTELDPLIVVIDEAQFYIENAEVLIEVVRQMASEERIVMLGGLNMDFKGEPFGPMPILMAIADQVNSLTAICSKCGSEACFTQRLINGAPAPVDSELVIVGAEEAYTARCRKCHDVPGKITSDQFLAVKQGVI